ncbi:MAG: hypothetical protein ACRC1J_04755, partial [Sandaracinobacteroides sp.]
MVAMLDARKSFRPDDPMRALGIRQSPAGLDDVQRQSIAAALLAGDPAEAIIAGLLREGVALSVARAELQAAADHPYLKAATLLKARLAKRDWLLEARARLERL